jgi:hypothetical protein
VIAVDIDRDALDGAFGNSDVAPFIADVAGEIRRLRAVQAMARYRGSPAGGPGKHCVY